MVDAVQSLAALSTPISAMTIAAMTICTLAIGGWSLVRVVLRRSTGSLGPGGESRPSVASLRDADLRSGIERQLVEIDRVLARNERILASLRNEVARRRNADGETSTVLRGGADVRPAVATERGPDIVRFPGIHGSVAQRRAA